MAESNRIIQTQEEADRKSEEKAAATGIEFFNVRTGESRIAETIEHMAAFFNSSDLGPNARVQDYGWRLAPEVVVEMDRIREDEDLLEKIAAKQAVPIEDLAEYHLLKYIAARFYKKINPREDTAEHHRDEYEERLRAARNGESSLPEPAVEEPEKPRSRLAKPKSAPKPKKEVKPASTDESTTPPATTEEPTEPEA